MTIGSILLGVALFIFTILFLGQPFLRARAIRPDTVPLPLQKEALIAQIKRLTFDYETGKLPADAYQQQRQALVTQTALILREMEAEATTDGVDADIEAAIQQLRQTMPVATAVATGAATAYCPQCGTLIDADDNFCASCGHGLQPTP